MHTPLSATHWITHISIVGVKSEGLFINMHVRCERGLLRVCAGDTRSPPMAGEARWPGLCDLVKGEHEYDHEDHDHEDLDHSSTSITNADLLPSWN